MQLFFLIIGVVFYLLTLLYFAGLVGFPRPSSSPGWQTLMMLVCATISTTSLYFFWIG